MTRFSISARFLSRHLLSFRRASSSPSIPSLARSTPRRLGGGGGCAGPFCSTLAYHYRDLHLPWSPSLFFSSKPTNLDDVKGPTAVDYRSLMPESEFHKLADNTIHDLQKKFEEFGDTVQIDGFDIDYGSEVLTIKMGSIGTYVINKQTPNRQIWLSSPVSGPSRYDWDLSSGAWIYRRTKTNLLRLLEEEIEKLCDKPIQLSWPRG